MKNKKNISIIIPIYNEEKVIASCLISLNDQTYKDIEIIVVDDGSTDNTLEIMSNVKYPVKDPLHREASEVRQRRQISNIKLLNQRHRGPGPARNLGAKHAKGKILVFVDADMTFDKNFIKDLTLPILKGKTIGTFSKNEMVKNKDNIWSICWNINKNLPKDRMIPKDYPNEAPVFRAILKKDFEKVGGFDESGEYTDDWSLSKKLGIKSTTAKGALYYHSNPGTLSEIWNQACWIGKNQFISGTNLRKIKSLIFFSIPISIIFGSHKAALKKTWQFLPFKIIYDLALWTSVLRSFLNEPKFK